MCIIPSITANTIDEIKYVNLTTNVYGLSGVEPSKTKLTKEQAQGIDILFNNINHRLNNAGCREEIITIFKETVEELEKYGLLWRVSSHQILSLISQSQ